MITQNSLLATVYALLLIAAFHLQPSVNVLPPLTVQKMVKIFTLANLFIVSNPTHLTSNIVSPFRLRMSFIRGVNIHFATCQRENDSRSRKWERILDLHAPSPGGGQEETDHRAR